MLLVLRGWAVDCCWCAAGAPEVRLPIHLLLMMIITARSYSIIIHITANPSSFVVNLSYLVCKNIFQSAQNIFDNNYPRTAFPGQILDIVTHPDLSNQ